MDFTKYENKIEYPAKPIICANAGSIEHRGYATQLEQYELELVLWKIKWEKYHKEEITLRNLFESDVQIETDIDKLPEWQRRRLMVYAWEERHSEGFSGVFNILIDLIHLIKE